MTELVDIFFGAAIASIVPIVTLVLNNSRWKKERRIEHLRSKHAKLEKAYLTINAALPAALVENNVPSNVTSLVMTHGSDEARKLFADFVSDEDKSPTRKKMLILKMSIAANKHLISIDEKIDEILT